MESNEANITEELCLQIIAKIREKIKTSYPFVQFKTFVHSILKAHVIAVNHFDFFKSEYYENILFEISEYYETQFGINIFDIYYVFEEFKLPTLENTQSTVQIPINISENSMFDLTETVKTFRS